MKNILLKSDAFSIKYLVQFHSYSFLNRGKLISFSKLNYE